MGSLCSATTLAQIADAVNYVRSHFDSGYKNAVKPMLPAAASFRHS